MTNKPTGQGRYWQVTDGTKCSSASFNHLAIVLRHAMREILCHINAAG